MSKRNRLFLGILALFALGIGFLLHRVAADFDTRYRESAEESLVDTAHLLAAVIETDMQAENIDPTDLADALRTAYRKRFEAKIYGLSKTRVDLQVYVTDAQGQVVFDSTGQALGQDYSTWRDVRLVLAGEYGARTTLSDANDPDSAVMYVAAPIHTNRGQGSDVVGVVSVGKSVASQRQLVQTARSKLLYVGLITVSAFLVLLVVFSIWLTRPFGLISDLLRVLRQEGLSHPWRTARRIASVVKAAFDDMRDALAGRSHTEAYVQTLTHELKSPLTAIRGAAELLREPMPDAQRERFVANISEQVKRLQNLADRLLELASLESRRTLDELRPVSLDALLSEALAAEETAACLKEIDIRVTAPPDISVEGDRFLLCQALTNILSNAIDFSPRASAVKIAVHVAGQYVEIAVRDHGPGVPDFAIDRVFTKFYSLRRPDTGRKSTGLGLAFVREIAQLHGGEASLANHPDGGALAVLRLRLAAQK